METQQNRRSGVQRVISDIVDLCELQWQLLSVDGQEAKRHALKAGIFLLIGILIALSALMAGVIGGGWLIHEQSGLSVGVSFLITCACSLGLAAIASMIGFRWLAKANDSLAESKREFGENVRWIKAVLLRPESSPRNQFRHESFAPDLIASDESRFQHYH